MFSYFDLDDRAGVGLFARYTVSNMPGAQPQGVHLVGSIRLPDEPDDPQTKPPTPKAVFQTLSAALPGRLRRIPDGEVGTRHYFVNWQDRVFLPSPWVFSDREREAKSISVPDDADSREIKLGSTGYDEFAIVSYAAFAELQQQGVVEPGVRFQVSIPTPANVLTRFVRPEYQAKVEPLYVELLRDAIRSIQTQIPPEKLAIQIDCALEFAILEGIEGPGGAFKPWFDPSPQALVDRIAGIAQVVDEKVQLGFHLCYGDLGHRHFVDPKDMSKLVNMANLLSEKLSHPIDFVQMPVPKDRTDDEYFAPLKQLRLPTEANVYLGLVHPRDLEGTERRIEAARKALPGFGVATECGWGRTPVQDVGSILEILKTVSAPV